MRIVNNLPQLLDIQRQLDNIDFLLGTHNISDIGDGTVTGTIHSLNEALSEKSDTNHNHDERYLQKGMVVNNITTTETGYVLDARQANPNMSGSLGAQVSSLNTTLATHKTSGDHDSRYCTKTEYNALNDAFTQRITTLNSTLNNKILKVEKTYLSPQIQIGANTYNAYTYSDFKDIKSGYTLLSTNVETDKDLVFTSFHYLSDSNLRVSFFNAYGATQTVEITVVRQIWLKN